MEKKKELFLSIVLYIVSFFDQIQHPFVIKTLPKNGHRRNLLQHTKGHI